MRYKLKPTAERKEYSLSYSDSRRPKLREPLRDSYLEINGGRLISETASSSGYTIAKLNLGEYKDLHPQPVARVLTELSEFLD